MDHRGRSPTPQPRLLQRQSLFHQSNGVFNVRRTGVIQRLKYDDFFHSLVYRSTAQLISILVLCYLFILFLFAVGYWSVNSSCDLQFTHFLHALYFSVETMITIGYGVPDFYFNSCWSALVLITAQSLVGILCDSIIFGVLFVRIARGQPRASTIVFSDKGIVTRIGNKLYFMFQVVEMRKHQLVEAHLRLYSTQHNGGAAFQSRAMRMNIPDDDLGGVLLLLLPTLVVHEIDVNSALHPTPGARYWPGPLPSREDLETPEDVTVEDVQVGMRARHVEVLALLEGIDCSTSATMQARHSYTADDIVFSENVFYQPCVAQGEDGECVVQFKNFHNLVQVEDGFFEQQELLIPSQ